MRAFGGAVLMAVLLVLYLALVVVRAVAFLGSGEPVGVAIGVALLVLPLIGAYLLVRELQFGLRATRLTRRLAQEEPLPGTGLPARASGRVDRAAADAAFPRYAEAAEAHPDDWRAWLRLGLAYDIAGDRRRARSAVRRAIALSR
jgi:hypothetical protein